MKRFLRTRRFIIAAIVVLIGAPAAWLLARDVKADETLDHEGEEGRVQNRRDILR